MTYGIGLRGLTFAIIGRAVKLIRSTATQAVAGMPKISCPRLICDVAQHLSDLAVFYFPKRLAAKLKIIALLVDRPTAVAVDQNALGNISRQLLQGNLVRRGLERNVWHARKGNAAPTIGMQAPVRLLPPNQGRQVASRLPIDEPALFDQGPALRLDPLIVITHRGQPLGLGPVRIEVAKF